MRGFSFGALLGLALAAPSSGASADAIYQFYGTMNGGPYVDQPLDLRLTVTDAAVAAGSMHFFVFNPGSVGCDPATTPCDVFGDPSGFVSFTYTLHPSQLDLNSTTFGYSFIYDIIFNPDGTLTGSITENGFESTTHLNGSEFDWSGIFAADFLYCPVGGCAVQGYFLSAPIPEPSTWALLLSGLAGIFATASWRKRRTAN